jgi:hypothetical protein
LIGEFDEVAQQRSKPHANTVVVHDVVTVIPNRRQGGTEAATKQVMFRSEK